MSTLWMRRMVAVAAVALGGCMGSSDIGVPGPGGEDGTDNPLFPGAGGEGGGENIGPGVGEEGGPAFEIRRDQLTLLPFRIRLDKVAAVLGVATEHPALADLRTNRRELGDHDFAGGFSPDRSWTATRVSLWVKSLRPVCASAEFKARFPSLPSMLDSLTVAAYGRHATAEDTAHIEEAMAGLALDEATRQQIICLAVLSSTEFVTR